MFEIYEELPDHAYRTEIPNIVFQLNLNPYEMAVYLHLKRIAGDRGLCWKSHKTLCEEIGIGENKLKECLKKLQEPYQTLNGLSLIKVTNRFKPDGSRDTNIITIIPIWRMNGDYFRDIKNISGGAQYAPGVGCITPQGGAQYAYKQDLSEEEPIKQIVCSDAAVAASRPNKIKINTFDEGEKEVTFSDVVNIAMLHKKDWDLEEINEAWQTLSETKRKIRDFFEYFSGIIENKRLSKQNKIINKKEQKCQNSTSQKESNPKSDISKNCKKNTVVLGTWGPFLAQFSSEIMKL